MLDDQASKVIVDGEQRPPYISLSEQPLVARMKNATAGKAVASVVFWFLYYLNLKLINTHEAPNSCVFPHSIFHPLHKAYGHPQ
jgi:hypothetical protein